MTFGLTPAGWNAPRLADIKQSLENAMTAQFGEINTDPQSVMGQLIGVMSKSYADLWENLEQVYFSQYPNSANGVALDNVVQLNGITRLPATQTKVVATCGGLEGTYIPINSLSAIPSNGQNFYAVSGGYITAANADSVIVKIVTLTTQPYTINLNNVPYTSSLPVITFSNTGGIFQSGQTIVPIINGITLTGIPFTTDSNTTLGLIATACQTFLAGSTVTPSSGNILTFVPGSGTNFNSIIFSITGSGTIATYVTTYVAPGSNNALTAALTAIINAGTPKWLAVDNMNGTITINANVVSIPFSCSTDVNLSITSQTSPITFAAQNFGPIACPIGALTYIVTPISGWQSVINLISGTTGSDTETDAELRVRRLNSIKILGAATVDAIQAQLIQKVSGVTSAVVYENRTLYEDDISIVFPAVIDPTATIHVTYNTTGTLTVPYNTSQFQTMTDLATAFLTIPAVATAVVGGAGNQTLTLTFNVLTNLIVNLVVTDTVIQTAAIYGGQPIKSIQCVVEGGDDTAVAEQIWLSKPAGIETFGTINNGTGVSIIDSEGNTQIIFFSRPTEIYIWVQVALTLYPEETFPTNGIQAVQQNIYNYGASLGVGVDVLFQRILAQIFTVSGIASGAMTIAATVGPTDSPSYGTADIPIQANQISVWNILNITVTVA